MANYIDNETTDIIGALPNDIFRPISHQDLVYLLNMHPFIQVINPDGLFEGSLIPEVSESVSGWKIIRYGNDAICSSPGEYIFSSWDDGAFLKSIMGKGKNGESDDGGGDVFGPGKGTIIKQTHDTVVDIINIVINIGWKGIELVDGTPLMERMLWLLCEEKELNLKGYNPDEEAKEKAERERRRRELFAKLPEFEMIRPK
jgi:hypothetical protein